MINLIAAKPDRRRSQGIIALLLLLAACSGVASKDSPTAPPTPVLTTMTVSLSADSISLGQTATATAAGFDQYSASISVGNVVWSSGSGAVTVNTNGVVTGVASGATVIIATSGSTQGQRGIRVYVPQARSVTIVPTSVTLDVGQSQAVTANVRDAAGNSIVGKTVTWLTSDATIVGGAINGNSATLQAVAAGSANVTASVDGIVATLPVTVRITTPKPVASVVITPTSATVGVGATVSMIATLRDAQGNIVTGRSASWTSSNLLVANGTILGNVAAITGLAVGVATITVTSEGIVGSAIVTVVSTGAGPILLSCTVMAGGVIYAQDGVYLGRLTNQFDSQSIQNWFGSFGSQFSSTSIYNAVSPYGSQFGAYSAYNKSTDTPPILFVGSVAAAYVSKNTLMTPRVDPDALKFCSFP